MKKERVNGKLEAAVKTGIAAVLSQGFHEGIKVMKDNQVPVEIAARVILSPKSRRSSDEVP
ncbi:MAG: hypothetical protein PSV17_10925 [Methylotenera sp.]|uniref:hypothetical protein n=1 Tax=Methylotenera sp. TaxID=2051956 RepID=UPI0024873124|nr:hypothetical protein [Methylotenera sp.]MDI1309926.1 hypothetical protein [Methylotenera sp.]